MITRRAGSWPMVLMLLPVCAGAQSPATEPDGPTIPQLPGVNPLLLRLVVEDQWDRGNDMFAAHAVKSPETLDWTAIARRDAERQESVRALMKAGEIESGQAWCVVPLAEQERILGSARAGGPLEGTPLPECP